MSFSIQTNVNSLVAQENLRVNSNFQGQTIQRLTSGYRINQSGDDAAGLAVANKFRSDVAELSQGVRNANDGISQLQIIDGGMNNVSKMLDRLRTLAAQSASDSFTGDRSVLNKEFSNVLSEIDRQAQSIGLDQNGQFAKALSVFVGGGRTHSTGDVSTVNGAVTVDLAASAVDSQSLGLKGMQLVAGTKDIGSTHSSQDVAALIANGSNTHAAGVTSFNFAGAGFSDASKIKVDVSLTGVTDIDTLVANINSAIANAGVGGSTPITAFRNTGITASVHTDANGGKQIAFTSTNGAFQVEARDVLANAFMGNITNGSTNGVALNTTTVTGGATGAGATGWSPTGAGVKVRISGAGLDSPIDIDVRGTSDVNAALANLVSDVNGDVALTAAGITVSKAAPDTSALIFTSARGEQFNVEVTGDTNKYLGFGSFVSGASNAVDYTSVTASTPYDPQTATGVAHFRFSINGGTATADIAEDLSAGNASAGYVAGNTTVIPSWTGGNNAADQLIIHVDGSAGTKTIQFVGEGDMQSVVNTINGSNAGVTASIQQGTNYLLLTSNTKGTSSAISIDGSSGAKAKLLFGNAGAGNPVAGQSRSLLDLVNGLNSDMAGVVDSAAGIQAQVSTTSVKFASTNNTNFRLSIAGTVTGASVGFGVANGVSGAYTAPAPTSAANSVLNSGNSNSTDMTFTAMKYGGSSQTVTFSAADSSGVLKSTTMTLENDAAARTGRSVDDAVKYINAQLQNAGGNLAKIVAVKDNASGTEKINFLSSLASFNVSVGADVNSAGLNGGVARSKDSDTMSTGSINVANQSSAKQAVASLAAAVATLGTAQAAVGKGQNQLNYAVNLAQSQISNFSAAESRIRDTDVAQEAANLTKAQVLQQASIAAMAQANSAPQAVLSLLRG
jgi:flagellin